MKIRSFLDVKRLANIATNINTREQWFLDYLKCISKPLQESNRVQLEYEKNISQYVQYNGQISSLKAFVNGVIDSQARRTIMQENILVNDVSFYGYYNEGTNVWTDEVDPNKTTLYGSYNESTGVWTDETDDVPTSLFGSYNESTGVWTDESNAGIINLTILVHNDIFSTLTDQDKDKLIEEVSRFIIAPYTFEIKGYEVECLFNGTTDYIDTNIFINSSTVFKQTIKFIDNQSVTIGLATYTDAFMIGQGSNGTSSFISVYGNGYHQSANGTTQTDVKTVLELNGFNKKALIDDVLLTGQSYDTATTTDIFPVSFKLGRSETPGGVTFYDYKCMGCSLSKNNITTYLNPHPNGYYFDNFGNIYYNRNSTYNQYPLNITLNII